MIEHKKIVAVDFDGTLCEDKYPNIGKPIKKTIDYLISLKKHFNCILILWTCRKENDLLKAVIWCKKRGLEFDYVNENTKEHIEKYGGDTRKIYADYYIDDKNYSDEEVMYKVIKECSKEH